MREGETERGASVNRLPELKRYFEEKLLSMQNLREYLDASSVVSVELDPDIVYDLIVLVPDQVFETRFKNQFGECFVVNSQEHVPPVFTRFKSYGWLRKDFSSRLPIALWIFKRSVVLQDPKMDFETILGEYDVIFAKKRKEILRRKYIEFRSDRHNLRQAVYHHDDLAMELLRANVVKIAIEILILAHGQPYPYKKWLPSEAKKYEGGPNIVGICTKFMQESEPKKLIALSDELVGKIVERLTSDNDFSIAFLTEWWLHLK